MDIADQTVAVPSSEMEDASVGEYLRLVEAIRRGDSAAEAAFVERFWPPVRALLLARSRNADLTADLLQDVMIEALMALRRGQLREPTKLPAFVAGVARNLLNNQFRQDARLRNQEEIQEGIEQHSTPPTQEAELVELQRQEMAAQALDTLSEVDREILQLTLVDGLKPGVIAEKLRMNPDVVRQRKVRATRRVVEFVRQLSQKPGKPPHTSERQPG